MKNGGSIGEKKKKRRIEKNDKEKMERKTEVKMSKRRKKKEIVEKNHGKKYSE